MHTLKLYYQYKGGNFGDVVNREIFTELFDCTVAATRPYSADALGIGSVLSKLLYNTKSAGGWKNLKMAIYSIIHRNKPIHVLGSGFIEDVQKTYPKIKPFRPVNIIGLRGKMTQQIMEKIVGHNLADIVLGDPGLLVSEFLKGEDIDKKFRMGIIPHVVDKQSPLLDRFKMQEDTCIIDIESSPMNFLRNVAACETIASSSLHGLITADSLHIPNQWIKLSDDLIGNDFKFYDYYSVYDVIPTKIDLRAALMPAALTSEKIKNSYLVKPDRVEIVKTQINHSFTSFFESGLVSRQK